MNLLELVTHLRSSILDDVGGTGISWANITENDDEVVQLRWTNEELTRFINEAEKRACRNALLIKSASSDYDITVVADTAEYALNSKIVKIKGAYLSSTGKELIPIEYEDMIEIAKWRDTTGTPTSYIPDIENSKITLYPKPESSDTIACLVNLLPTSDMSWDTNEVDSPQIREEYHLSMLNWAAHLAYLKDEANTFDPGRSEYFRALFEREFSDSSAYGETRRRRSTGRAVRYNKYY